MTEPTKCLKCTGHRSGWCQRAKLAGLSKRRATFELGVLATMHQNCSGFRPIVTRKPHG